MRREHWSIVGALLDAIERRERDGLAPPRRTHLADDANVAFDRLVRYLHELHGRGLTTDDTVPRLTPRGRDLLEHYREWSRVLDEYALTKPLEEAEPPR